VVLPGKKFNVADVVGVAVRRGWMVLVPFALGLSTAPLISKSVPKLYRSETLIRVIPQRVPDSYVKSTVMEKMEERLPAITSVILSRSRLEKIVRDFNLYETKTRPASMEDLVARLRRDIDVKAEGAESFRVNYVSDRARTAQDVTARLAALCIEENLRDRANLADETNAFLESQLSDAKVRLIEHEKKLEEYRRRFAGQLPTQDPSGSGWVYAFVPGYGWMWCKVPQAPTPPLDHLGESMMQDIAPFKDFSWDSRFTFRVDAARHARPEGDDLGDHAQGQAGHGEGRRPVSGSNRPKISGR
jgi:hypothetical protein